MYTLYYSPGSCSLVIHCLLLEMQVPFELSLVDLKGGREDYRKLNPKGKVPALGTSDGVLTEAVAIIEFLCDRHDKSGTLLGAVGSWERARLLERMATLASEVHPMMNRFFHDDDFSADAAVRAGVKAHAITRLLAYFAKEDAAMAGREFWSGDRLTAADFYFMVVARWGRWLDKPANEMPGIRPFYERMIARPHVARAFATEGIKTFGTP